MFWLSNLCGTSMLAVVVRLSSFSSAEQAVSRNSNCFRCNLHKGWREGATHFPAEKAVSKNAIAH
jgi:hypothetical protein